MPNAKVEYIIYNKSPTYHIEIYRGLFLIEKKLVPVLLFSIKNFCRGRVCVYRSRLLRFVSNCFGNICFATNY